MNTQKSITIVFFIFNNSNFPYLSIKKKIEDNINWIATMS